MSAPCCLTCECGPHEAEEQAFEAMREALQGMIAHNVVGIYNSNNQPMFPTWIAVALADHNKARAALALADKVSR